MSMPAPPITGTRRIDSPSQGTPMSKPSLSAAAASTGGRPTTDPKAARAPLREITLVSGRKSDFYFNLKPTMLDAEGALLLAELTLDALAPEELDYIGGLEMGAVPIASAVAALSALRGNPLHAFFVRKQPKEHG